MEILSTGEKIKRARVYKGLTLRELCKGKISVSKMSCIENNKIKPELWVLEFVSEILDINLDYLKKDIKQHLIENYEEIKTNISSEDIRYKLKMNIDYAQNSKHYDLAMKFMHLFFIWLLNNDDVIGLREIQCKYYEIYENAYSIKNQLIYFIDLATFLYLIKQYEQAANYFKNVRTILLKYHKLDFDLDYDYDVVLCNIIYDEAVCNFKNGEYKIARDLLLNNEVHIIAAKENKVKFKCYSILTLLCYKMQDDIYKEYRDKALLFFDEDTDFKIKLASEIILVKLELGENKDALKYIDKVKDLLPETLSEEYTELIFKICHGLIKTKLFDECEDIIRIGIDNAILLEDSRLIQEAYYIKGLLAIEQKNNIAAETNMSISLDCLKKIGSKEELYYRYIEMGDMYYNFNNVNDSLKCFNLALYTSNCF